MHRFFELLFSAYSNLADVGDTSVHVLGASCLSNHPSAGQGFLRRFLLRGRLSKDSRFISDKEAFKRIIAGIILDSERRPAFRAKSSIPLSSLWLSQTLKQTICPSPVPAGFRASSLHVPLPILYSRTQSHFPPHYTTTATSATLLSWIPTGSAQRRLSLPTSNFSIQCRTKAGP